MTNKLVIAIFVMFVLDVLVNSVQTMSQTKQQTTQPTPTVIMPTATSMPIATATPTITPPLTLTTAPVQRQRFRVNVQEDDDN